MYIMFQIKRNLELKGEKLKDKTKALNEKEYSNKIKENAEWYEYGCV